MVSPPKLIEVERRRGLVVSRRTLTRTHLPMARPFSSPAKSITLPINERTNGLSHLFPHSPQLEAMDLDLKGDIMQLNLIWTGVTIGTIYDH